MDSLSQAVLGAAVGVAVAGRRIGARKAALTGAVLGTVPDLDVFYPYGDPVSDFVLHRGPTHSLIVQALVTPLFAEPLVRFMSGLRERRWTAYLMVYLVFATHALLDAMTVYGTRLFWPLSDVPVGLGSVFIIDPLYTLPLLAVTVWALARRDLSGRLRVATHGALALSTLYLGWSVVGQQMADARASVVLDRLGIAPERAIATPTPFNTLFWRVIAIDDDRFLNVYVPLLGVGETVHVHDRGADLPFCLDQIPAARTVAEFSKGFVRFRRDGDRLRIGDLRMGLTPSYVFDFQVAEWDGAGFTPVLPVQVRSPRSADGDWDWLLAGIRGEAVSRPVEHAALLDPDARKVAQAVVPAPRC